MKLGIIGGGRAAWALARSWIAAGGELGAVSLRSASPLARLGVPILTPEELAGRSDSVALAVSDDAIAAVADTITRVVSDRCAVWHLSGSVPSEALAPAPLRFSLHPLRALPPAGDAAASLAGTLFTFEGSVGAEPVARSITERLGGRFATIPPEQRTAYHAAAVFGANFVAATVEMARQIMVRSGLSIDPAEAIHDLARSSLATWAGREGAARFTGPVMRGDVATIRRHLQSLDSRERTVYVELSLALARFALAENPQHSGRLAEIVTLLEETRG